MHAKSFEKCTCENCGKHFVMGNPYTDFGEGGNPSFVNLERFERKEIDTIWDYVVLCGDCMVNWKNKRTKIRKKYPASLKEAQHLRNNEIYRCSLCKKRGHNRLTCPLVKKLWYEKYEEGSYRLHDDEIPSDYEFLRSLDTRIRKNVPVYGLKGCWQKIPS